MTMRTKVRGLLVNFLLESISMDWNKALLCQHPNGIHYHQDAPLYCPDCNRYMWHEGKVFKNVGEMVNEPLKFPLDWLAKELGVWVMWKVYHGNANPLTLHRVVIANRILSHWLGESVERERYTIGEIYYGLCRLKNENPKDDIYIELNTMEYQIYLMSNEKRNG